MALVGGFRAAIKAVTLRAKNLMKLQVELARAEIQRKGRAFGAALAMFVAAAVLGFFVLALVVALLVAVLAIWLPVWLAILIVLVLMAACAAGLAMIGARTIKKAGAPVPARAVAQAKRTQGVVRDAFRSRSDSFASAKRDGAPDGP
jgi:protein-S-isoprenylcysteine O-methyltransferase Ste14